MIDQKQIQEWLEAGTITKEQAEKMLTDATQTKKEVSSGRFITAIVTLGSVLFGVGAILLVSLNWGQMSHVTKILFLVGLTFGSYYLGYVFAHQKKNYPRVGASLIFLGALLFGASTFLIAQIYNLNSNFENSYILLGIWIIGVLPMVYGFLSSSIAALVSVLFFACVGLLFITKTGAFQIYDYDRSLLDFFVFSIMSGVVLFSIGGFHYVSEKLKPIGRMYRLFGLQISVLIVFLLSLKFPYYALGYLYTKNEVIKESSMFWVASFAAVAFFFSFINLFFRVVKTKIFFVENVAAIIMILLSLSLFSSTTLGIGLTFRSLFTIAFATIVLMMLYAGYKNMDMGVVNKSTVWITIFIIAKYFEWFWEALNPFVFFMAGGVALIVGGIFLEKKRKKLKMRFVSLNQ